MGGVKGEDLNSPCAHSNGSDGQNWLTTQFVNVEECRYGGQEHDDSDHTSS